ncbi:MAG: hypothetical protein U1E86_28605 [Burkholderiaceae bacterium]
MHGIVVDSVSGESALEFSTIAENTVSAAARGAGDGIRIEGGATANPGNRVQFNTISGSANHDCHDATTGGGTAGTDSFWAANGAATQNVANLCFTGAANGVADWTSATGFAGREGCDRHGFHLIRGTAAERESIT